MIDAVPYLFMCDSFARKATIKSHILCASFSPQEGMEESVPVTLRLKALRERAAPRLSVRKMAELLEMPASTYAAYEDRNKFKKPILPFDMAKRFAAVLGERGISRAEVMALAGLNGEFGETAERHYLDVVGPVAAGIWREQAEWPPSERYKIEVGPNPVPGSERFAVRMEGLSMNLTIPPNSDLECLRVAFGAVDPRPGDLVIVERTSHDLTEMTCKRLDMDGEEWILRAESSEPEFSEPIRIGKPDTDHFSDNEIRVIGIVISSQQRHFRKSYQ